MYVDNPHNVEELNLSIRHEIYVSPKEMFQKPMPNFEEGLQNCIQQRVRRMADTIFQT